MQTRTLGRYKGPIKLWKALEEGSIQRPGGMLTLPYFSMVKMGLLTRRNSQAACGQKIGVVAVCRHPHRLVEPRCCVLGSQLPAGFSGSTPHSSLSP